MIGIILAILLFIILLFALGIGIYFISIYNGFVRLRNDIEKAWANINVLLKQRSDELPKLIASVKGYMKHEKKTLEDLTKARTMWMKATTVKEKAAADNMMTAALKSIFAVAENYPKLQAQSSFAQLQERISGIENSLADRREFYNDSVNSYNIRRETFPDSIVAGMMKLIKKEMFQVSKKDTEDVKVEF